MTTTTEKRSKVENYKDASNFLREPVATEVKQDTTHFSVADEDPVFTREQIDRFDAFVTELSRRGIDPPLLHAANTAGGLMFDSARYSMVRAGFTVSTWSCSGV